MQINELFEILFNHFLVYEFVYVFLFCSFIFLFLSIIIKKDIIKKLSILLFSVFIVLFLFEFILSFFMSKPENIKYANSRCTIDIDRDYIYKSRQLSYFDFDGNLIKDDIDVEKYDSKKYSMCKFIYNKSLDVYNNGFRVTKCNENSEETCLFLGCSFTFGDGVGNDETLPYYFSQLYEFNKNVINCGFGGHSSNNTLNILYTEKFKTLMNNKSKIKQCFYSLMK